MIKNKKIVFGETLLHLKTGETPDYKVTSVVIDEEYNLVNFCNMEVRLNQSRKH